MRVRTLSDAMRIADRIHAGGVIETIRLQLDEEVLIDVPRSREALNLVIDNLAVLLEQCYCLEQKLEASQTSLGEEKRLALELRLDNRDLVRRNADLEKTNRRLKKEIEKHVHDGRL